MKETPKEQHLKVLRNLAARRDFFHGFVQETNAVRAMFECILKGWVDRNQLTFEGRAVLEESEPIRVRLVAKVLGESEKDKHGG